MPGGDIKWDSAAIEALADKFRSAKDDFTSKANSILASADVPASAFGQSDDANQCSVEYGETLSEYIECVGMIEESMDWFADALDATASHYDAAEEASDELEAG